MFEGIKSKLTDMATIKRLCESAEAHALREQRAEPGAEHYLLAAIDLPDGTARLAFQKAGANADELPDAIQRQYADALRAIGIAAKSTTTDEELSRRASTGVFRAAYSGQEVMQALAGRRKDHGSLLGAHVVSVVATMTHGVAARALCAMGVDLSDLGAAAEAIINRETADERHGHR